MAPVPGFKEYIRTDTKLNGAEEEAMASLDRDIGALQEAVSNLQEAVKSLTASVTALQAENSKLQLLIAEGKGGWKMLTFIGGLAAAVGALMAKLWPVILSLPR